MITTGSWKLNTRQSNVYQSPISKHNGSKHGVRYDVITSVHIQGIQCSVHLFVTYIHIVHVYIKIITGPWVDNWIKDKKTRKNTLLIK